MDIHAHSDFVPRSSRRRHEWEAALLPKICLIFLPIAVCTSLTSGAGTQGRAAFASLSLLHTAGHMRPGLCHERYNRRVGGCVGAVRMVREREKGEEDRFLGSRRIAQWLEQFEEEDAKFLWSKRLAKKVYTIGTKDLQAHAKRKGQQLSKEEKEQKQQLLGDEATSEVLPVEVTEVVPVQQTRAPAAAAVAQGSAEPSSTGVPPVATLPRNGDDKQEWGTIFAPATSFPTKPNLLPALTQDEEALLLRGGRLQKQTRDGLVGTGMVAVDVHADISTVFAVLTDLERYPERISTVRKCVIYERGHKVAKAQFSLSRFMLKINTRLSCERDQNTLRFELDKERLGFGLEEARGFWFLENAPGREEGWTRVWLYADISCSPLLPTFLVDYAASRALPRATTWLSPVIESIAQQLPPGAENVRGA